MATAKRMEALGRLEVAVAHLKSAAKALGKHGSDTEIALDLGAALAELVQVSNLVDVQMPLGFQWRPADGKAQATAEEGQPANFWDGEATNVTPALPSGNGRRGR